MNRQRHIRKGEANKDQGTRKKEQGSRDKAQERRLFKIDNAQFSIWISKTKVERIIRTIKKAEATTTGHQLVA
jgi:hypothetical protein